jgi:hypothetical protein
LAIGYWLLAIRYSLLAIGKAPVGFHLWGLTQSAANGQ